mmetsp:Transcript_6158/g.9768  ORF Transcript_6158/g.9768 Transcript_6158/m.9768 type:complete len:118 (+) Transcript_6158:87-440(+)
MAFLRQGKNPNGCQPIDGDEDVSNDDKLEEIQSEIQKSQIVVQDTINKAIDRGDNLLDLEDKANSIKNNADVFRRNARSVQRAMCFQNIKMNLILLAVLVVVALIVYFAFIHPFVNK